MVCKPLIALCLVGALMGFGGRSDAASLRHRIVSLNLCTDELLLDLAPRSDLVALSPLARDCAESVRCEAARAIPVQRADGEGLLAIKPDIVFDGVWHVPTVPLVARALHIPFVPVGSATSLADIPVLIRRIAAAIGQEPAGEAMATAFSEKLQYLRPRQPEKILTAVVIGANLTSEDGGVTQDMLTRAGFRVPDAQDQSAPSLERLLASPPDLLILDTLDEGPSLAEGILHHPALSGRFEGVHRLDIPARLTLCGTPDTLDTLARLVAAHDRLTEGKAP